MIRNPVSQSRSQLPKQSVRSAIRPTIEGSAWLFVSILLIWQSWIRGVNLLAMVACFLLAVWLLNIVWVLFRLNPRKFQVRRELEGPIFAETPTHVALEVFNPTRRTQYALRIEEKDRTHTHCFYLPQLSRAKACRRRFRVRFPHRGRYQWPPLRIATGYPFGLLRRIETIQTNEATIILPKLGRLRRQRFKRLLRQKPDPTQYRKPPARKYHASQNEFHSLREYRSGDSYRWIHWRTTARVGDLMVREFAEPPIENLTMILDPWIPAPPARIGGGPPDVDDPEYAAEAERLELAIRLTATICWEWSRQPGARLTLAVADARSPVLTIDAFRRDIFPLLETLALVEGGPINHPKEAMAKLQNGALPRGQCILVTARANPWTDQVQSILSRDLVMLDLSRDSTDEWYDPDGRPEGLVPASRPR